MSFLGSILQIGAGFVGKAIGGSSPWGFVIGNLIGGILFGPKAQTPKAKAQDLKLQKSEYGEFIPIYYGTVRAAGVVVDCDDKGGVEKKKKTRKVKTGLLSSTSVTEWRYFLTCAVMLGEGVYNAAGDGQIIVDKLFYGDDVIFDRAGTTSKKRGYDLTLDEASGVESSGTGKNSIAFCRGTWRQMPDPTLATLHGGTVPAYRGQAYVRIWRLPLQKYDNELRAFTAIMRRVDAAGNTIEEVQRIVRVHMERAGVPPDAIQLSAISGTVRGAFMTQRGPARELCERLAAWKFCDLVEVDGAIRDADRANPTVIVVDSTELGARLAGRGGGSNGGSESGPRLHITHEVDASLPSSLVVSFQNTDLNYDTDSAQAVRQTATHENIESVDIPIVATLDEMTRWARAALDEAWEGRRGVEVALPHARIGVAPGDVLQVPTDDGPILMRVASQTCGAPGPIICQGKSWSGASYVQPVVVTPPPRPIPVVAEYALPVPHLFEANLNDHDSLIPGFYTAFNAPIGELWRGVEMSAAEFGRIDVPQQATIGQAVGALAAGGGAADVWDSSVTATLDVESGALQSASADSVLSLGLNRLKWGGEILQFTTATPGAIVNGRQRYVLSNLRRGQRGTSASMSTHVAGETVILLDDAVERIDVDAKFIGVAMQITYHAPDDENDVGNTSFTVGAALQPAVTPPNFDEKVSFALAADYSMLFWGVFNSSPYNADTWYPLANAPAQGGETLAAIPFSVSSATDDVLIEVGGTIHGQPVRGADSVFFAVGIKVDDTVFPISGTKHGENLLSGARTLHLNLPAGNHTAQLVFKTNETNSELTCRPVAQPDYESLFIRIAQVKK